MAMKPTSFDYKHLSYLLLIEQEIRSLKREKNKVRPKSRRPANLLDLGSAASAHSGWNAAQVAAHALLICIFVNVNEP